MLIALLLYSTGIGNAEDSERDNVHKQHFIRSETSGNPFFSSPHSRPIAIRHNLLFVANTPAATVEVVDTDSGAVLRSIPVGIDPVSVAIRPDGREAWVSCHVSDCVTVIDSDPASPSYLSVIATIQEFDADAATIFDEPVGIAFAGNEKAYVALSSRNEIAVIDVRSRRVKRRLQIPAQDPRSIVVQDHRLYVIPFESNNQTQLSGGNAENIDGDLVTFDAWEHSIRNNNVLSLGHVVDIVRHPDVPDRDLFIFDTESDELVQSVDTLGTLLYGLAVASDGTVFIAQTEARNDVNGRSGSRKHDLSQLQNRPFLNRITRLSPADNGPPWKPDFFDLEPLPPDQPGLEDCLATPFAVELSSDGDTLVVTAAGSDRVAVLDASNGKVLGKTDVGSVPRGLVLQHKNGQPAAAWVLNAVSNSISQIDLSDRRNLHVTTEIELPDPTPPQLKRGRMAFETAAASSTGTFACASCHPDGHTDQLLWVLSTPIVSGGNQIMPRSTMPIRGLRDTEPYHWDGIPGDPYGGNNSAQIHGSVPPNSEPGNPLSSARHLIDGGLATTMSFVDTDNVNDEGKRGKLDRQQRDDMAEWILSVMYPPAPGRPYTDAVTERARRGFELFHILGDDDPSKPQANVCGNCHRMPFLVSTNTPGTGMDAPTWRGANDRYLILPQGRLNIIEFPFYRRVAEAGQSEQEIWKFSWAGRERFNPVWDMVLQMSTGFHGSFARQVTLTAATIDDKSTSRLFETIELASADSAIVLNGEATTITGGRSVWSRVTRTPAGDYYDTTFQRTLSRTELLQQIRHGHMQLTLTARLGSAGHAGQPQPALWTAGPMEQQRGLQEFPVLAADEIAFTASGRHIDPAAAIFVDGHRVAGEVRLRDSELVEISLSQRPDTGLHLLQLQNPQGLFSNEFLVTVVTQNRAELAATARMKDDPFQEHRMRRLLGTWVDEETGGENLKLVYQWKLQDHVIEHTSVDRERSSVALIVVDGRNRSVVQTGGDNHGVVHTGTWTAPQQNENRLQLEYTGADGETGELELRYRFASRDRMTLILSGTQIEIPLRRVQAKAMPTE